jgi:ATP dependent DNA ligase C terminal region
LFVRHLQTTAERVLSIRGSRCPRLDIGKQSAVSVIVEADHLGLLTIRSAPLRVGGGLEAWGLTAEKMKECVWVKPREVAEVEFLEWTGADHLRHTKFRLRDDKDSKEVIKEN